MSEGEMLKALRVKPLDRQSLEIVLTEGKKHQIRRMLSALHFTVKELRRVRIMDIHLGTLAPGEGRELRGTELDSFLRSLSLPVGRA
jgi:23S rRNA pseudouridine2604 synthase